MRFARPVRLSVLALLVASGCRTAGVDNLARRNPPPLAPALDARTVIDEHNRNAEQIETMEAHPTLTVRKPGLDAAVNGRLALERPRNFKLDLSVAGNAIGDIGSNDEKFWFWLKDNSDKKVFYCNHDDAEDSPQTITFQPDWIIEALGLRVIPKDEIGEYKLTRGSVADQLLLTHPPTTSGGETITRVTIFSEKTHRILEHQLWTGAKRTMLARATVEQYMNLAPEDDPDRPVYVPQKMKLEWYREKMAMWVMFNPKSTKVNLAFDDDRREALFVQGEHRGYDLWNLASGAGVAKPSRSEANPSRGETGVRETLSPPPAGAGVQLGNPEPAPLGVEGARRTTEDPIALSADLPERRSLSDSLVGPSTPRAPELEFAPPANVTGWRRGSSYPFER